MNDFIMATAVASCGQKEMFSRSQGQYRPFIQNRTEQNKSLFDKNEYNMW